MKILINALSGNGDALMFTPALKILKKKLPSAKIDVLVMYPSVAEIFRFSPYINEIILLEFLKQSKFKSLTDTLKLRNKRYDISVNIYPSNRTEYNLVNFIIGAKRRVATSYIHSSILRLEFLNNCKTDEIKNIHNVLQNLNLVRKIIDSKDDEPGNIEIFLDENNMLRSKEWFENNFSQNDLIIGFHAGSAVLKNHINKRWNFEKYAMLANNLIEKYDAKILLFGTEKNLNEKINDLTGKKCFLVSTDNFMDSLARIQRCNLFVTNDSAFLHSAAGFKIPTVAIFGYTNYKELFPWQTEHIIVRKDYDCSPCFYNSPKPASCKWKGDEKFKCINHISVEEVFDACKKLLNTNQENPT